MNFPKKRYVLANMNRYFFSISFLICEYTTEISDEKILTVEKKLLTLTFQNKRLYEIN